MTDENFTKLRKLMDATAPIDWVSTPDRDNSSGWVIHFSKGATSIQQQETMKLIESFIPDPVPAKITDQIAALPGSVPSALKDVLNKLAQGR